MCGFVALIQRCPAVDVVSARRALARITHRGPDASGEWHERDVFLGHRRLSIIDLDSGGQPMHSSDGRYVIVFNGEIYNYLELRERLLREGGVFRTRSDTEVIIEGYRRWGKAVVDHLNGMFAFVLWDRLSSRAFVARDRLGIKPLCWAMRNGSLIVSSTLEPFSELLEDSDCLDFIAIRDLMTFDYVPAPHTIFKGIRKLEPGSRFEWRLGSGEPQVERYWMPPLLNSNTPVPDEFELEDLLERAVKRQMISDVPIGAFLSGGIDSSLMVALMSRHSERPVRTFSVAFNDQAEDESRVAQLIANQFGTDHTVLRDEELGSDELLQLLGNLDEPFCDPTFVATYVLSKMTRKHVKVALSGDGGDEVFGGYTKYITVRKPPRLPVGSLIDRSLRSMPWRPRGLSHLYERSLSTIDQMRFACTRYGDFPVFRKDMRQLLASSYQEEAEIADFFLPWERRARRYGSGLDGDILMRADLETYLSENCLVKTDRASMLASLEVRVPYLDEMVLERILPLPAETKIAGGQLKALLMPIVRRLLPRQVWDRPKHGFNVPLARRLATSWGPAVQTALEWGEKNLDLFNYRYLHRLQAISRAEGVITNELWNPFVLLAWKMAHA
jgi:asparagine synthase (glutamine-hydrolysing)